MVGGAPRSRVHRLRVALRGVEPAIWRRLLVPSEITLGRLHGVLQAAMGWHDTHLHHFVVGRTLYGPTDRRSGFDRESERQATLASVAPAAKARFLYEYDFADSWVHEIEVEDVADAAEELEHPRCLAGARACPPEDCGGPPGYADLLEALKDPAHPGHRETRRWLGGPFDPDAFDVVVVNRRLARRGGARPARPGGRRAGAR